MAHSAQAHGRDAAIAAFKKTFRELAPYKHNYEVFRDFVTMAACSLHNAVHKDPAREEEYLRIIAGYKKPDQEAFPKLMGHLVEALDSEPRDILGPLYMELEIANKDAGQFFTPPELSDLMANLTFGDMLGRLETQPFITAGEPACGAGGMILALVKVMIAKGYNPSEHLWLQCIDVDRNAALMCYTQLSLADFGQPVLNLQRAGNGFQDQNLGPENRVPMLDGPKALEAAEFLIELLSYSPPNVLQMSWYERAKCYADGQAAMAYCYTQILPMIENRAASPGFGRTGYLPHPSAPGVPRTAPLGGWNVCVPANVKPQRFESVLHAARVLTSAPATKLYIENGSLVSSRFSVCNDPVVAHGRPVIATVDKMARSGQLQTWSRPSVPQFNILVRTLGEEIHAMLLRNKKPRAALRDAQARCEKVLKV